MWAFEVIPRLGLKFAREKGSFYPRILNWECSVAPSYKDLEKAVFDGENVSLIFLLLYNL